MTGYVGELAAHGAPEATSALVGDEFNPYGWRMFDTSRSGFRPQLNVIYE